MDNLVDIDELLGRLELETEQFNTLVTNGHTHTALQPNGYQNNSLSNGHATHQSSLPSELLYNRSSNYMDDLLDLSEEPDFSPELTSLQTSLNQHSNSSRMVSLGTFPVSLEEKLETQNLGQYGQGCNVQLNQNSRLILGNKIPYPGDVGLFDIGKLQYSIPMVEHPVVNQGDGFTSPTGQFERNLEISNADQLVHLPNPKQDIQAVQYVKDSAECNREGFLHVETSEFLPLTTDEDFLNSYEAKRYTQTATVSERMIDSLSSAQSSDISNQHDCTSDGKNDGHVKMANFKPEKVADHMDIFLPDHLAIPDNISQLPSHSNEIIVSQISSVEETAVGYGYNGVEETAPVTKLVSDIQDANDFSAHKKHNFVETEDGAQSMKTNSASTFNSPSLFKGDNHQKDKMFDNKALDMHYSSEGQGNYDGLHGDFFFPLHSEALPTATEVKSTCDGKLPNTANRMSKGQAHNDSFDSLQLHTAEPRNSLMDMPLSDTNPSKAFDISVKNSFPISDNIFDMHQSVSYNEMQFNRLLAENGFPLSEDTGGSAKLNGYSSPTLAGFSKSGSRESFTKLQNLESQSVIDSFTALHNMCASPHRNSLLEQNGIKPQPEMEDMGWDIGAGPDSVAEVDDMGWNVGSAHELVADDILREIGLDEPVAISCQVLPSTGDESHHISTPKECPTVQGYRPIETGPIPTTEDLQSMVVHDEEFDYDNSVQQGFSDDDALDGHAIVNQMEHPLDVPQPNPESATSNTSAELIDRSLVAYLDLGATKPLWLRDADVPACMACGCKFTMFNRRHHCRACGKIFCNECSKLKSRLQYMDFEEARVCKSCHENIALAAEQQSLLFSRQGQGQPGAQIGAAVSQADYTQQDRGLPPGVLRDTRSSIRESNRSVIFSDGIRPGDENSHLDGSDVTPSSKVRRKIKNRQSKPNQRLRETLRNTFLIPHNSLPPLLYYENGTCAYSTVEIEPDEASVVAKLKGSGEDGYYAFAIHKDLHIEVRVVSLDCAANRLCWCFTSHGLATVSQDEVVFVLECLPEENCVPKDVFHLFRILYQQAVTGSQVTELGYVDVSQFAPFVDERGFLGSKEQAGLLFVRSSFQSLKGLSLPDPPFLFAILLHRLEVPWARLFPIRLMLRLGAEFKYYPCPLISVRHRAPVYSENTNTIMNLLADFHTYKYCLSKIEGFTVNLQDKITTISIPRNMYAAVMKVVGASQDCVIAFGASFSPQADSHLVCIQNPDGSYTSHAMNIRDQQRAITGASFVVFNGSLKESAGVSAKCSIVEDGIMVQITKEALDDLKNRLKNTQEYTVQCGRIGDSSESNELVKVIWVDDYKEFNVGVVSPIDGFPMDGVVSLRVKSHNDLTHNTYTIRWIDVFFVQLNESRLAIDAVELTQLSETIATSTSVGLAPFLQQLYESGMKKIALRVTLGPEQVEYICGSMGHRLSSEMMNSLDGELVPVLHSAVSLTSGTVLVFELVFYILE